MKAPQQKIQEARAGLVIGAPFFASLALHLKPVEDRGCPTAYTDTVVFGYNPGFIDSLSVTQVKALLAHEVLHIALGHAFRKEGRDHFKWNMACDHAINWILKREGYSLPTGGLLDLAYQGKSAEEIYSLLPDKELPQPEPCPWEVSDTTAGSGQQGLEDDTRKPLASVSGKSGISDRNASDVQSGYVPGMTGEVREYREDPLDEGHNISWAEQEAEWRIKIAQAAQVAKIQGSLPSALERMVKDNLTSRLPWTQILSRFLTENGRDDYVWSRPSARYLHAGLYLPALNSPTLGRIAVAVDTSGSVGEAELSRYAAEIRSVLSVYPKTEIHVLYTDTKVAHHENLTAFDFELHPKGGGGTSYVPAFEFVEERGIEPVCLLYFTDGYCQRFPDPPDYPVLWMIEGYRSFDPPFGEVAHIGEPNPQPK